MSETPTDSEVTVFRKFVAKLMTLQNLDCTYHTNQFFLDHLMTAIDILHIKSTLRDRMPRTSQQAVDRIANQLSDKTRTAGSNSVCTVNEDPDSSFSKAHYSLGKSFGGEAIRTAKPHWKSRKPFPRTETDTLRLLIPAWIRGFR